MIHQSLLSYSALTNLRLSLRLQPKEPKTDNPKPITQNHYKNNN